MMMILKNYLQNCSLVTLAPKALVHFTVLFNLLKEMQVQPIENSDNSYGAIQVRPCADPKQYERSIISKRISERD